jgi:hypothetical protein
MKTMNEWESAWGEYVDALDNYDADWSGEDFVHSIGRAAARLNDAKSRLRAMDRDFCQRIGI